MDIDGVQALIDVNGVGYEVLLPEAILRLLPSQGETVTLLTRQIFREDGVTLYGFVDPFQRRLFDLLLSVQGCGPKASLALIGQLGEDSVARSILAQDSKTLTRANGVGPKLAERIILELKTKMQDETAHRKLAAAIAPPKPKAAPVDELVETLLALGYRRHEAEPAAAAAREEADDLQDQLKAALRRLQKA